jgi:hypothetical protein
MNHILLTCNSNSSCTDFLYLEFAEGTIFFKNLFGKFVI